MQAQIYGTEYHGIKDDDLSIPCAVCVAPTRTMVLMIPARIRCPDESWTKEYTGYLMTDSDRFQRTQFICIDEEADTEERSSHADGSSAYLFPVSIGRCGPNGFDCDHYIPHKKIACVVCTK